MNLDFIADLEDAPGAAANQPRAGRIEDEEIAVQSGDMNSPVIRKSGNSMNNP